MLGRQRRDIHDGRIVAQSDVQPLLAGSRDGQCATRETRGHVDRLLELRIAGDGIDQEQVGAGELTHLLGRLGALQMPATPADRTSVASGCQSPALPLMNDAKLQRTEGGETEGLRWIEGGHRHLGIGEREPADSRESASDENASSSLATSMLASRLKLAGDFARTEKISTASCGS